MAKATTARKPAAKPGQQKPAAKPGQQKPAAAATTTPPAQAPAAPPAQAPATPPPANKATKPKLPKFPGLPEGKFTGLQLRYAKRIWAQLRDHDHALLASLVRSGQLHEHILGIALSKAQLYHEHVRRGDMPADAEKKVWQDDVTELPDRPAKEVSDAAAAFAKAFEADPAAGGIYVDQA